MNCKGKGCENFVLFGGLCVDCLWLRADEREKKERRKQNRLVARKKRKQHDRMEA